MAISGWGMLCTKCNRKNVTIRTESRVEYRKLTYYHPEKELERLEKEGLMHKQPEVVMEPVHVVSVPKKLLCTECKGGKGKPQL